MLNFLLRYLKKGISFFQKPPYKEMHNPFQGYAFYYTANLLLIEQKHIAKNLAQVFPVLLCYQQTI